MALIFFGLWLVYCLSFFALPLHVISRLCFVLVALPSMEADGGHFDLRLKTYDL